jgi:hypothetical protein
MVYDALERVSRDAGIDMLIHGCCSGADAMGREWADGSGVKTKPFPPEWVLYGPAAGPIRNQRMLDEGKPDLVVAFPGGRGTADMVRRARAAGVEVWIPGEDSDRFPPDEDLFDTSPVGGR